MTEIRKLYDFLGKSYLTSMYLNNSWTNYVDKSEKIAVADIWGLDSKKNKDEVILDLGMGPGRWSKFFVSRGFKNVVGLDLSPRMVEEARKYIDNSKFKAVEGDMERLPFADGSFDKIFCFRALKYVPNPKKAISEMGRVLKSKGTAVIELSNKTLLNTVLKYISLGLVKLNPGIPLESRLRYFAETRFYTRVEVQELIKSCKFRVISYRYFALLPSVPLPQGFTWLWTALDGILFKVLPKQLFSRSIIFLISK